MQGSRIQGRPGSEERSQQIRFVRNQRDVPFSERPVANEVCDAKHVSVNGKVARASYDVKIGDVIEIQMGANCTRARVLDVSEHATKENAALMFELL